MSRCQMTIALKTAPRASYQAGPQVVVVAGGGCVRLVVGQARCYTPTHRDIVVGAGVGHADEKILCPALNMARNLLHL